jgi:hypothetical protein
VDSTKSTSIRKSHEKGISTSRGGMLYGNNPLQTLTRGSSITQGGRVTGSTKNRRSGNGNEDLKGKRKVWGSQIESGRRKGKRYRLMDEGEDV